jgi:hypothetical protein
MREESRYEGGCGIDPERPFRKAVGAGWVDIGGRERIGAGKERRSVL